MTKRKKGIIAVFVIIIILSLLFMIQQAFLPDLFERKCYGIAGVVGGQCSYF